MDLGLEGRVAAVAASTSGLGLAAAVELAREGAKVAVCSRSADRVQAALGAIRKALEASRKPPPALWGAPFDLSARDGPEHFISSARSELGPVDILVASNGGPPSGPVTSFDDAAWQAGFEGTFLSAVRLARAALPSMKERGWGRIIFITSVSVKQPIPDLGMSTALRSAVVGLSKVLSDELAQHGVTVNCVAPGSIRTARLESLLEGRARKKGIDPEALRRELEAQVPLRRFGKPEELAAAIAFLASERASYITGAVLPVDGGVVRSLT